MLSKTDLTGISLIGVIVIETAALATGHDGELLVGTLGLLATGGGFGAGYVAGITRKRTAE